MKNKNKKATKRNEFRKHKGDGHPKHIYEREGNDFKYIGITHSAVLKDGTVNVLMDKNPDPFDTDPSYFTPRAERDRINRFHKPEDDMWLSQSDNEKMKPYRK